RRRLPELPQGPAEPEPAPVVEDGSAEVGDLAALVARIVGSAARKPGDSAYRARVLILGLDPPFSLDPRDWPTQAQVAEHVGVSRARVGQILGKDRQRWLKDRAITRLRDQVVALVDAAGGVLELGELVEGVRGQVPAREGDAEESARQVTVA